MIVCTNYGLLVYDFSVGYIPIEKPDKASDSGEEQKEAKPDVKQEEKTVKVEMQINLVIKYKLSVLPDEQVIDCVILDAKRPKDSQLLVCCASGSYVILRRLSSNSY